ncbi:tetratricopeptide repeat protein 27-like isoform X2 [Peromyscus maniculatus bairdii]|uniref:tetratricopeptide repeat protein 27-like isoform X2 n=1 Tax=Peromyscus maniculatus bairdii TaxID=230844 RepID=UPI003FD17CC4
MPGVTWTPERALLRGFSTEAEQRLCTQEGRCGSGGAVRTGMPALDIGVFLDLLLEGSYEAMFLHSVTRNIFSSTRMAGEKIDSYLEKQIVNFLDCSTDLEDIGRGAKMKSHPSRS